jgi:hypothetical protein
MTDHLTEHSALYAVGLSVVVAVMAVWMIFSTGSALGL